MKRLYVIVCVLLTMSFVCSPVSASKPDTRHIHRVMTCNIRIAGLPDDDSIPGRKWEDRRDVMLKVILSRKPDIVCTQEVIYKSYAYMKAKMKGYQSYGFAGPEMDPYTDGYHFIGKNVIFWKSDRYEFVSSGCYWLSDHPEIGGSVAWGTARARHCNWVRLRDKSSGVEFRVMDIHLDHISEAARQAQMKMAVAEAAQYASDFPQILCGDFNSGITSVAVKCLHEAGWNDSYEAIHGAEEVGYTAHNFKGPDRYKGTDKIGRRIDFIFSHGPVKSLDSEILKDCVNGIYPSDHYFMYSDLEF